MRVSLITTGRMELLALPQALTTLFPGHEFVRRRVGVPQ
jgi:hypothetical protein